MAIFAQGTLIQIGDGTGPPESFTTITGVRDITGPGEAAETIEVTDHDSVNAFREWIAGLRQAGSLSFSINYDPTDPTHDENTGLRAILISRQTNTFRIVFTDTGGTTFEFEGFVTQFQSNEPVNGALTADVTIQITGQLTTI